MSFDIFLIGIFGWKMGFEPTTLGTTILYSNRLSYIHHLICFPNRCANIHTFFVSPKFLQDILLFIVKNLQKRLSPNLYVICYLTRRLLPICKMVVDLMLFRLHILFTVVPYLRAIAPRVSPFFTVWYCLAVAFFSASA